ncbi:hypothetical protein [Streptomyces carpinensis]|uniref:Uncharacterized protein n=1 Tax=Streptomyces carpinensis TaxID=66369 RepID=A0ABV1WLK5_9ACTN|nr:hypothetical protein [Streptomyces carpinensis]
MTTQITAELAAQHEAARKAAAQAGPTDGDKLIAALGQFGIPAFFAEDCGVSYVLVGVDRTADEGDAHTGPKVFLYSEENADLTPEQHTEPWAAALYDGEGEFSHVLFTAQAGLDLDAECAHAALCLACWLTAHGGDYPRARPEPAKAERGPGEGVVYGRLPGSGGRTRGRSVADVMFGSLGR